MNYVLKNGDIVPESEAMVSLDDIDITYGYGVYETLKVRKGVLYYPKFHEERLFESARILGIDHTLSLGDLVVGLNSLVQSAGEKGQNCNLKVLLIGHTGRPADLYAFVLNPLYPDRKEVRYGTLVTLYPGERHFPQAKSLSMLLSTVAFRQAKALGAYDALLVNRDNHITEGTRTNMFYFEPVKDRTGIPAIVYTPPLSQVLNGITRRTIIDCFEHRGISTIERPLPVDELRSDNPPALFVCSTSTKILPVKTVVLPAEDKSLELPVPQEIKILQNWYDEYLVAWTADQEFLNSSLPKPYIL
jgi:branched-subunit amino acid aminotransferase/4-amino-4-deoxychorismate lyase